MGTLAPFCVRLAVGQYTAKNIFLITVIQLGFNKLMVKIYPAILSAMIGPDHAKKGPSPAIKRSINKFGEEPSNQCMRLNHKEWSRYWASDVIFSADSQFERTQIQEMHAHKFSNTWKGSSWTSSNFDHFWIWILFTKKETINRAATFKYKYFKPLSFNYVLNKLKFSEIFLKSSVIQGQQHFSDLLN